MIIEIDDGSGFCFGVTTAIKKAEEELARGEKLYCLGDIVHNGMECDRLRDMGLITINHDEMRQLHNAKVLCYSGFYGTGVKEIWDMIYEYIAFVKANGYFDYRRNEQSKYWMYESINEHLRLNFYNNPLIKSQLASAESSVLAGQKTSFIAAQDLLDEYFKLLKK